ncbi:MAG: Hsp20/alpha crystallin family protein [Brevinematia bacterium]
MLFNPFYEIERMRTTMDELWKSFLRSEERSYSIDLSNIYEGKDGYIIQFLAPDVSINDISVKVSNGILTVNVKRKIKKEEGLRPIRNERYDIDFTRSFRLSDDAKVDGIEAKLINGLLMVFIPRKEEAKPKKVSVKVD